MKFDINDEFTNLAQQDDELIEAVYTDEKCEFIIEKHKILNNSPFEFRLAIKRADRKICHSWRILQDIKDAIAGEDMVAIEIYPKKSEITDTANIYHLWVFKHGYGPKVSLTPPIKAQMNDRK